jgi:hypothetical protein
VRLRRVAVTTIRLLRGGLVTDELTISADAGGAEQLLEVADERG